MKSTINSLSNNIVNKLIELTEKSDLRCNHSAVLVDKKRNIISTGYNYTRTYFKGCTCTSVHAEQMAIGTFYNHHISFKNNKWNYYRCKNRHKKNLDLIVIRVKRGKNGIEWRESAPCSHCLSLIKEVNIRRVIYTTGNDDEIALKKVNDIESEHVTVGNCVVEFIKKHGYLDRKHVYQNRDYG